MGCAIFARGLIFGREIDARATAGNVGTLAVYFFAGE
jgi:hypothetical protein